ncbi:hypothetical protein ROJ8625_03783 [Roseivivax jejudonensis]|uniref:Uncharacterized protein n=1 Tax=Roseivivax jejudonensis TaxID=1529041 RepID=A0A1X7A6Y2_9RHOB|nr:hypothetical protein [Roseivivax jejudonensis]SLN72053.1 hypothetical protein ROJ8625_03783 [Roseivivax jejudonensis]
MNSGVYQAGRIKRGRATGAEMEARADFLISYANLHGPVTVRQLFYAATVAGLIEKSESGYGKVQAQVLALRRAGRMPYSAVADATRYMRKPRTYDGWQDALRRTAQVYRKALWADAAEQVEIWIEKSALAGVIAPVTSEYDVPLMPTGGFSSETFAFEAVNDMIGIGQTLVVYSLYDFDRSGRDAARSLRDKLHRFGTEFDVPVVFHELGLTYQQVIDHELPTRPAKRKSRADQRWPYEFAAELDAMPPDLLRRLVESAIEAHLPHEELTQLKNIEAQERATLMQFIGRAA